MEGRGSRTLSGPEPPRRLLGLPTNIRAVGARMKPASRLNALPITKYIVSSRPQATAVIAATPAKREGEARQEKPSRKERLIRWPRVRMLSDSNGQGRAKKRSMVLGLSARKTAI